MTATSGPTIILSGGTGYIGRSLLERLLLEGYRIVVLTRNASDLHKGRAGVTFVEPAKQGSALIEQLLALEPAGVVHFAAEFSAGVAPFDVDSLIGTNIAFAIQLMEVTARASGSIPFVAAGSFWQRAAGPTGTHPNSLYAASKEAAESFGRYYAGQRGCDITFLQLADVYGGAPERGRFLDLLVAAIERDQPIDATAGDQVVSFVHITDVENAVIQCLNQTSSGSPRFRVHSLAGRAKAPLRAQIEMLEASIGVAIPVRWGARPYRDGEVLEVDWLDPLPGWHPKVELAEGFRRMMNDHSS